MKTGREKVLAYLMAFAVCISLLPSGGLLMPVVAKAADDDYDLIINITSANANVTVPADKKNVLIVGDPNTGYGGYEFDVIGDGIKREQAKLDERIPKSMKSSSDGGEITNAGSAANKHGIEVEAGFKGNITLRDVHLYTGATSTIEGGTLDDPAAMMIRGVGKSNAYGNLGNMTRVKLILEGDNTLWSGLRPGAAPLDTVCTAAAGLEVERGAILEIEGDGNLYARSGNITIPAEGVTNYKQGVDGGAGIGGGNKSSRGGHIIINSGNIVATGSFHGAGIGGGWDTNASKDDAEGRTYWDGTILIRGGSVYCTGGGHGAGIGGGCQACINKRKEGTVIVLPSATVNTANEAVGGDTETYPYLGAVGDKVYIGDRNQKSFTVRTSDNKKGVEIFMEFDSDNIINGIRHFAPDLTPNRIPLGKTALVDDGENTAGVLTQYGQFEKQITFFTDEKSDLGYGYKPVVVDELLENTPMRDFVLELQESMIKVRYIPGESESWDLGYGNDNEEFKKKAGTIRVTNIGRANVEQISVVIDAPDFKTSDKNDMPIDIAGDGKLRTEIKTELPVSNYVQDAESKPTEEEMLARLEDDDDCYFDIYVWLVDGLPLGKYNGEVTISADAIDIANQEPVEFSQWVGERLLTVSLTTESDVVNKKFDVLATFSEPVQNFDAKKIGVTEGTVTEVKPDPSATPIGNYCDKWIITVEPNPGLENKSKISIIVQEGAATDNHAQGNKASPEKTVTYDLSGPEAAFGYKDSSGSDVKVDDGHVFIAHQPGVWVKVQANGTGQTEDNKRNVRLDSATGPLLDASNAATVFQIMQIQDDGTETPVTPISIEQVTRYGEIRLDHSFPNGKYKLILLGDKLYNESGNSLERMEQVFEVRVPNPRDGEKWDAVPNPPGQNPDYGKGIKVEPEGVGYTGGEVTVTIYGDNLQYAGDMLQIGIPDLPGLENANTRVTPDRSTIAPVPGTDYEAAHIKVTLPPNPKDQREYYPFTLYFNGSPVTDGVANAYVDTASASISKADGHGLTASPETMSYNSGTIDLTVKGINLHNYPDLTIRVEEDSVHLTDLTVNVPVKIGESTIQESFAVSKNTSNAKRLYTFKLYSGGNQLYFDGTSEAIEDQTEQGAATPEITSFTVHKSGEGPSGSLEFDHEGGTVYFNIDGYNLQHFEPLIITNDQGLGDVDAERSGGDPSSYDAATASVVIPSNYTNQDIVYTMTLTRNNGTGTSFKVTITVKKPELGAGGLEVNPQKHDEGGGYSTVTVRGTRLNVGGGNLYILNKKTGEQFPVTDFNSDGSVGTVTILLPPHEGGLRNDIHELEAWFEGAFTGLTGEVEVGPSAPSVTGVKASPNYYATASETSQQKSTITVLGNYLSEYDSLQIYDEMYDRFYSVSKAGCDMEASCSVTIPSAEGIFSYYVWADGEDTGYMVNIYIGIEPGDPYIGEDKETRENPREDKEWSGRSGGVKGGGFTGRQYVDFDLMEHQAERLGKENPDNPSMYVADVDYVSKEHFMLVMAGARRGATSTKMRNQVFLTVYFDTLSPATRAVEGRLTVKLDSPVAAMYTGVYTRAEETQSTLKEVKKKFTNANVRVVRLGQNEKYGTEVEVAVNLNLDNFETTALRFYSIDRETGEYNRISNTDYFIDTAGYLHFTVQKGGDIIITDQPLINQDGEMEEKGKLPIISRDSIFLKKDDEED